MLEQGGHMDEDQRNRGDSLSHEDGLFHKAMRACENARGSAFIHPHYASVIPLAMIAVIALFYVSTIREGHTWGDDFALYVLHAENIADGKGYTETPYVHNPLYTEIGPKAYPPVFPLALAPAYKWVGFNLTVMKVAICTFFLAALWVLFLFYRAHIPYSYAVALVMLLGFNPYLWDFKDEILSDFPFLFFVWATLYGIQRHYDSREKSSGAMLRAVVVGMCMYLAYGTRVIGAVLPASLLLYELVHFKRLSRFASTALLVAATLMAVQAGVLSDSGSDYIRVALVKYTAIEDIANVFLDNIVTHFINLSTLWDNGYNKLFKIGLFGIVSTLSVYGLKARLKAEITIDEIFLSLYLVVLLVTPFPALRYLIPVIPLYFLYACLGVLESRSLLGPRWYQYAPLVLTVLVVLSYASKYTTLDYGPIREGIARQESQELFQHIRAHTKPDDVLIFRKPRALALITGRRTSIYPMPSSDSVSWDGEAWDYFHHIGAHYFVVGAAAWARNPVPSLDIEWERHFVERYKDRCKEVFSNADFKMYELKYPSRS